MKRIKYIIMILLAVIFTACGKNIPLETPLEDLPTDFSLNDAKKSGCVVHEDGDISAGEDIWEEFLDKVENKEPAKVRLADYYTLDEEKCDPEYYESVKDDYPVLYLKDLTYDGESFCIRSIEDGEEYVENYKYLKKMIDEPESDTAEFILSVRYVLVDDETVTWDDIFQGLISSQLGAYVKNCCVYTDYIYNEEDITETPQPIISGTKNIWIMGDSIAGYHKPEEEGSAGWGSYLQLFLNSGVSVKNTAVGGASASSYFENGAYDTVMDNLEENDIVLIQFGHNDAYNMDIYTDPYEASDVEGSFKNILKEDFILPILEKGAYPVLATSVVAADFDASGALYTMIYADHAQAMRDLASECQEENMSVYLIDTYAITEEYYKEIGESEAQQLHSGGNHYNKTGAIYAADVILNELRKLGFTCCNNLRDIEEVTKTDAIGGFDICALGISGIVTNYDIELLAKKYQNEGMSMEESKLKSKEELLMNEALHRQALEEGLTVEETKINEKVDQYIDEMTNHELQIVLNTYVTEEAFKNYLSYHFQRELIVEKYIKRLEEQYLSPESSGKSFDTTIEEYKTLLVEQEKYVIIINRGYNIEQ